MFYCILPPVGNDQQGWGAGVTAMQRRRVLQGAGVAGALAIGGIGTGLFSGGARATASQNFGSASVTSNDGSVEYVAIFGDSVVEWKGFERPAQYFDISIEVEIEQDWDGQTAAKKTVHETGLVSVDNDSWGNYDDDVSYDDEGREGTIETGIGLDENGNHDPTIDWHIVGTDPDDYGLPSDPIDASHMKNSHDGETRSFTLYVRSTYTWYDVNENHIFDETFTGTVDVDVENIAEQADSSDGSGEDGATAE